jgi:hypothetical protein
MRSFAIATLLVLSACAGRVEAVAPLAAPPPSAPPPTTAALSAAPLAGEGPPVVIGGPAVPPPAARSPAPPLVAPPPSGESVEDVATRIGVAWAVCDKSTALALSLSYEDVTAMTRKTIDRVEWDHDTHEFMDERCREFGEAHARVVGAKQVRTERHLQAEDPDRLKMDVQTAFVQLVVEHDGQREERGLPLLFILTPHGFRFAAKH